MSSSALIQQRLYNQKLIGSRLRDPEQIVAWLGCVQAQDYAGGKWTVGLRGPGLVEPEVESAVTGRRILRTWTLRGTLHFVCARDIRWMLGLMAPRVIAANARRYRELELDEAVMARATELMAEALRGGEEFLRPRLLEHLRRNGISTQGQRAAYLLQRASLEGRICQVGVLRNNPLYLSLDKITPEPPVLSREAGAAELARRYFASHAPASLQDFTTWSGLLAAEARSGFEAVKPGLVEDIYAGKSYWRSSVSHAQDPETPRLPLAWLLPSYDEFLLGYSDRGAMLDRVDSLGINLGNGISPTFAIDGRIAGVWKRTFQKGRLRVAWTPFRELTGPESQALSSAIGRYAAFLGLPLG